MSKIETFSYDMDYFGTKIAHSGIIYTDYNGDIHTFQALPSGGLSSTLNAQTRDRRPKAEYKKTLLESDGTVEGDAILYEYWSKINEAKSQINSLNLPYSVPFASLDSMFSNVCNSATTIALQYAGIMPIGANEYDYLPNDNFLYYLGSQHLLMVIDNDGQIRASDAYNFDPVAAYGEVALFTASLFNKLEQLLTSGISTAGKFLLERYKAGEVLYEALIGALSSEDKVIFDSVCSQPISLEDLGNEAITEAQDYLDDLLGNCTLERGSVKIVVDGVTSDGYVDAQAARNLFFTNVLMKEYNKDHAKWQTDHAVWESAYKAWVDGGRVGNAPTEPTAPTMPTTSDIPDDFDFIGSSGHEKFVSGNANDELYGNAGIDELHGGGGDDIIEGGADNDWLYGDAGDDIIDGVEAELLMVA